MDGASNLWLVLPIFAALFYAMCGILQNYVIDTAVPKKRGGSFIVTHVITFSLGMLLVLAMYGQKVFMLPLENVLGIVLAGAINVIGSVYYYKAYQSGDTVDINIYSEVGPLISLGLGVAVLGQSITATQAVAFLFIMAAALLIVFSGNSKKNAKPDLKTARLTVIATIFSVTSDVVFIYFLQGTRDHTLFAQTFFFFELGSLLMTVVATIFFDSWRKALRTTFLTSKHRRKATLATLGDNLISTVAEIFQKYGLIMSPILALFSVVSNVAKLIAGFVMAILLGRSFPKFIHAKKMTKQMLRNYAIAGILIIVGVLMING